jgi:hypothetical protein
VNTEALFPALHRTHPHFCLMTLTGKPNEEAADFSFWNTNPAHLLEVERHFTLTSDEITLLNPKTRTCPVFRSRRDARLTLTIHRRVPPFCSDKENESWNLELFKKMLDFGIHAELIHFSAEQPGAEWTAVYEAKMIGIFSHRFSTYAGVTLKERDVGSAREFSIAELANPTEYISPRCWVKEATFVERMTGRPWGYRWFISWRHVTNTTNERTAIFAARPYAPCNDTLPSVFSKRRANEIGCLLGNASSFVLDFVTRQKVGGTNLGGYVVEQLPVLSPTTYAQPCQWTGQHQTLQQWLLPRVLELTYTAWDLEPFARDCGYDGPPFRWDEARRFLLRCELDAAFFHLYGITHDDAAYILDTFPIVKRKDIAAHGTYRTQETILGIFDAMAEAQGTGKAYQTLLNPSPADSAVAHPPRAVMAKPELPSGTRQPAPNPQVYLMQLTILLVHRNRGTLGLDRMLDACALLSLPDMLAKNAAIEVGDPANRWRSRFNENIQADLFLPMLRDLIGRGVVRLKREGTSTLVVLTDASAVPSNPEVAFDASLALDVVNSMASTELDALPRVVPDEAVAAFLKVA